MRQSRNHEQSVGNTASSVSDIRLVPRSQRIGAWPSIDLGWQLAGWRMGLQKLWNVPPCMTLSACSMARFQFMLVSQLDLGVGACRAAGLCPKAPIGCHPRLREVITGVSCRSCLPSRRRQPCKDRSSVRCWSETPVGWAGENLYGHDWLYTVQEMHGHGEDLCRQPEVKLSRACWQPHR
jgi:hypothetical protein